ncbi:unnamed protein product, partial [Amoebophrya sp. A120]|eukprot:GSA120T00004378001.1
MTGTGVNKRKTKKFARPAPIRIKPTKSSAMVPSQCHVARPNARSRLQAAGRHVAGRSSLVSICCSSLFWSTLYPSITTTSGGIVLAQALLRKRAKMKLGASHDHPTTSSCTNSSASSASASGQQEKEQSSRSRSSRDTTATATNLIIVEEGEGDQGQQTGTPTLAREQIEDFVSFSSKPSAASLMSLLIPESFVPIDSDKAWEVEGLGPRR